MEDWKNWQGRTRTSDLEAKELAKLRVYREGGLNYYAAKMTEEQIRERRMYLRRTLAAYSVWENLSNDALNDIRLYNIGGSYIVEDSNGYEFFLRVNKTTPEETAFRKARAMIPFEFIDLKGKDFRWEKYKADVSKARDMINRYTVKYPSFRDKGIGLYIYSCTKGSGKTMLASCLANEITDRYSGSVKFVNILDLIEMTKKGFNGYAEEIESIYKARLLFIDDIGVQMSKEWVDTVLYRLINERYNNRLPTVYTSNIPIEQLKMDDRIVDRIESTIMPVKLPEESIRKEVRQQEKDRLLEEIENAL